MGENYAFFLPVMMASFSFAFLIVWSWGIPAAAWWSAAFFCVGGGFAAPAGYAAFPSGAWCVFANLLFGTGFLLFSEALLRRWRPRWLLSARLTIWGISILTSILACHMGQLPLELVASDFGCFLLIALPLVAAKGHLRGNADRALFAAATLVALDNLVRGSTVPFTLGASDDFFSSNYAFLMQALASIFGLFLALSALATQVVDLLARYRREAMIDPLSGLFNRRGFDEAVAALGPLHAGSGSLILCDIDHFKAVNDEYGHALGDRVIAALARLLAKAVPSDAIVARFGGEEFVLFLPGADAARAAEIANAVRERFASEIGPRLGLARPVTASFGLSAVQGSDGSIQDSIVKADQALYEAKAHGRNRVCIRRALSAATGPAQMAPRMARA